MEKQNKETLRKTYLLKREALDASARLRDSAFIRQQLFELPVWKDAGTVLSYVSFSTEADTHKILAETLSQGKRVLVPVTSDKNIVVSELHRMGDMAAGPFRGIYEPSPAFRKIVDVGEAEIVLVPGLAFDREGGRLGFGAGYFDKLLIKTSRAIRIGLAFSAQISDLPLPREPHDRAMNFIITEKEVIFL